MRSGRFWIQGFYLLILFFLFDLNSPESILWAAEGVGSQSLHLQPLTLEQLKIKAQVEQKKLSNGLNIIMVEDHSIPVISFQTWYRVGSVDEMPGYTGISHMFEHLMFKGTQKYGPREFFRILESHGAEINAYTTRDYTVYYNTFVPSLLEKVIDMESDRMTNLVLNDEVLEHERMVVLQERNLRAEGSPEGKMQEALWQLSFRHHPYHWPVIGFPADIINIKVSDLQNYYKAYFQPANASLILVGNFDSSKAFDWIKKYYGNIPAHPRPERKIPVEPPQNEERRLILRDQITEEKFFQGYHVTSADNNESYAIDVLSNILFEGNDSRAYRKLVEEENILNGINGSSYTPTYPGLLMISGVMKNKIPFSKAETALDELINQVQEKGVTEQEVKIAVRQLTMQMLNSIRTPFGLGQLIGTLQVIFDNPHRLMSDMSKYMQVTPEDVQNVAKKYLNPNNRSVVNLVPLKQVLQ